MSALRDTTRGQHRADQLRRPTLRTGAKLTSSVNNQVTGGNGGENGGRVYAQYGLVQSLPLGKRWTIDATFDASTTVSGKIPAGGIVQPFQTTSSGSIGGTSGAAGGLYGSRGAGENLHCNLSVASRVQPC